CHLVLLEQIFYEMFDKPFRVSQDHSLVEV
ncbi:unnamed protein product, partial [marine sediment metagenome]